jgi:uncharacterized protein (TIGR00251 family)
VLIDVHVQPKAKVPGIVGVHGDRLKVAVRQPPQDGKANLELIALLAATLLVPKSAIELIRGATSRQKTLRIAGISEEQVRTRLAVPT